MSKHRHYYKNVEHLKEIDVYRVLELFEVTNPCLAHAVKKLLVAGGRGAGKDQNQDVCEAVESCQRFLQMRREDERNPDAPPLPGSVQWVNKEEA